MSEFKFSCPRCGQKFQGEERYAGKQMLCPACNHLMHVPTLSDAAANNAGSEKKLESVAASTAGKK